MTEHEGNETTAELAGAILRSYREGKGEEPAEADAEPVSDIEAQADKLAAAAERLRVLLAASASQPRQYLDAFAVLNDLSQAAGSIAGAAAELQRQERFGLADDEARAMWDAALAGLRTAMTTFAVAADGWV